MKNYLFLLGLVASVSLHAETQDVSSRISAVTVYADRARVTRTGEASLPAGESVLRFSGLPQALDASSVQAKGKGAGAFKILGIEIRDKYSEQVINERVRELEQQLEALGDLETQLNDSREEVNERREFLQKVRNGLTVAGSEDGKVPPQGLDKVKPLYEFYGTELAALSKQKQELAIQLREMEPKRQLIQDELNRLRGNGARTEKEVLVAVSTEGMTKAEVSLSYNMYNASWQPTYDARVNTKSGAIALASYGTIRQQTGENWENVNLSLSTARPSVGARMPELHPWWIQIQVPVPMTAAMPSAAPVDGAFRLGIQNSLVRDNSQTPMEERSRLDKDAEFETARIDSSGVSAVFSIKLPANIPSDGEPHKVPIATQNFEGALEYVTTPKLSDVVYLKARLTNTSAAPLLGGAVNLFRDDDFVGTSRVNFIASGAKFDFFLGVDDSVKVVRKTLVDKSIETGIIQKRKGTTRKYEMTVDNFKSQPIKVTLYDQLPVSQDSSITVSEVKFNEAPTKDEKDTGKLTWEFSLEPNQKKTLTEEFTVSWPPDKQVEGL